MTKPDDGEVLTSFNGVDENDALESELDATATKVAGEITSLVDETSYDGRVLRFAVDGHKFGAAVRTTMIGKSAKQTTDRRIVVVKQNALGIVSVAKCASCYSQFEHAAYNDEIPSAGIAFEITPSLMKALGDIGNKISILRFELDAKMGNLRVYNDIRNHQSVPPFDKEPRVEFCGDFDAKIVLFDKIWQSNLFSEEQTYTKVNPRALEKAISFAGLLNSSLPANKNSQFNINVGTEIVTGGHTTGVTSTSVGCGSESFSLDYHDKEAVCRLLRHFGDKEIKVRYLPGTVAMTSGRQSCVIQRPPLKNIVPALTAPVVKTFIVSKSRLEAGVIQMAELQPQPKLGPSRMLIDVRPSGDGMKIELKPVLVASQGIGALKASVDLRLPCLDLEDTIRRPHWDVIVNPHDLAEVLNEFHGPWVKLGICETKRLQVLYVEQADDDCIRSALLAPFPEVKKVQRFGRA